MKEKLLTFAVPCYNSADYMRHCISTLLTGGDRVEIVIINDGSKDDTLTIANKYAAKYPDIVRVVDKENGGHGSGVNAGIDHATGLYYKVVDSDDWVSVKALSELLDKLEEFAEAFDEKGSSANIPDLVIANYVYEKEGKLVKEVVKYHHLPKGQIFGWDRFSIPEPGHYLLMHSIIYRTGLLKECGLRLPEHMFYVDNIYAYVPLPYVKRMYYLDINLYRYFIGRPDQSVHEDVMIGRVDQQIAVNKIMIDSWKLMDDPMITDRPRLQRYMLKDLEIITTISSILLIRAHTDEALQKKEELWKYLEEKDPNTCKALKHRFLGGGINIPGRVSRKIAEEVYLALQKVVGFS